MNKNANSYIAIPTSGSGAPWMYDYINANVSQVSPSTVHVVGTGIQRYIAKYLVQKAMSVYDWTMPDTWAKDYALYCLYLWGYFAVFNTDKYGVIPQGCSLKGYDIMYRPTTAVIANPLFTGTKELRIGKMCTLIKLQPDYSGIYDIITFYSSELSLLWQSFDMNVLNSKLSYMFATGNKAGADTLKTIFDSVAKGEPAVFYDKAFKNEDGSAAWEQFNNHLKENYIANDLLIAMRTVMNQFNTEIGIPTANTDKRERLVQDEVNANNVETMTRAEMWLKELQSHCKETREMFGIDISVDWRNDPHETERGVENASTDDNTRDVSV